MIDIKKIIVFIIIFTLSKSIFAETLTVGITIGPTAQNTFFPIYSEFESSTGIKIRRYPMADMKDLDDDNRWFDQHGKPIDILLGHASERLLKYYSSGKISSLNELWNKHHWQDDFQHIINNITFDNKILGLPYQMNGTHIFFKKSVLKKYGALPNTLTELESLCLALTKDNIIPFYISSKKPWTAMAWFEYIILRTHGLSFFNDLTAGKISYTGDKVNTVLTHWQKLVKANCYSEEFGEMHWNDTLPLFSRNKIAMMFGGNFIIPNIIDNKTYQDLATFNFPKIADIPRFESIPVDLFIVNNMSEKKENIEKFLTFAAQSNIQGRIATSLKSIPANNKVPQPQEQIVNNIYQQMITAAGASPFIDRALLPTFEKESRKHFLEFIREGNIEQFQNNLEFLRLKHYPLSTTKQTKQ